MGPKGEEQEISAWHKGVRQTARRERNDPVLCEHSFTDAAEDSQVQYVV